MRRATFALAWIAVSFLSPYSTSAGASAEAGRLEAHSLESLKIVKTDIGAAVVRTPDGSLQVIREGDVLGESRATVVRIQKEKIILLETERGPKQRTGSVVVVMPVVPSPEAEQVVKRFKKEPGVPAPTYLVPGPVKEIKIGGGKESESGFLGTAPGSKR